MRIHQITMNELELSKQHEEGLEMMLENKAVRFSALNMFAASLGQCTFAVLDHYALRLDIPVENLTTHINWTHQAGKPAKISAINLHINWPELPQKRLKSIARATKMCTIHNTIHECVKITTQVTIDKS